jgi:4-diphosphocytidyl-2-C-methyl-D-erythritol kinase
MKTQQLTLLAPAKINLTLKVIGRRPDGYHELDSWMHKITLFDEIRLEKTQASGLTLSCPDSNLPEDKSNLVCQAAIAFYNLSAEPPALHITLKKNIPVAAGLGGGSSDCATVLLGLNQMFGYPLSAELLLEEGKQLGADVPFFVKDFVSARAQGIGERLTPVAPLPACTILLVNPGIAISTGWVFSRLQGEIPLLANYSTDSQKTSGIDNYALTREPKTYNLGRASAERSGLKLFNDLEEVTLSYYPEIALIKQLLQKHDAIDTLMSGSGSTVFGLFLDKGQAAYCKDHIQSEYPDWHLFLAEPLLT